MVHTNYFSVVRYIDMIATYIRTWWFCRFIIFYKASVDVFSQQISEVLAIPAHIKTAFY